MQQNQGTTTRPPPSSDCPARHRFLEEQTSEFLWQIDAQGRLLHLSPSCHRLTGQPPAPLIGHPLFSLLHPDDLAPFQQALTRGFQTPGPHCFPSHRLRHGDGSWRWFSATATLVGPEENGQPASLLGLAQDITARVRMEAALKQSQALLSATQHLSRVGGWEWDPAAQAMTWTDETYRIHGLSPDAITPGSAEHIRLSQDCYRAEDRPTLLAAFHRCVEQGQPYDLQLPFTSLDGRRLWVRTMALPVREGEQVVKVIGNLVDITHHKQVEMILRARLHLSEAAPVLSLEALVQKMLDQAEALTNSSSGFFHILTTPQTVALQVWSTEPRRCSSANEETGWNGLDDTAGIRAECIRRHGPVIDNGADRSPRQEDRAAGPPPLLRQLAVPIIRGRELVAVFGVGNSERDYDQRDIDLVRSLGDMTWDIVLRKRAEMALVESEERFRQLFDTIPAVAVQGYRMDGTTQYWNQASERLYGYSAAEALGRNLLELIIPASMRPEVARAMEGMATSGEPLAAAELLLMRRDGSRVPVFSSHAVIDLPGRPLELFCVDIDLSAHKQIEAALRASENHLAAALAEKEVLLREVHHRVKNNLAAIIGLLDLQGQYLDSPAQISFLAELSNRIRSMSLVHEQLYQAESLASINFEHYIQALVDHLQTSFGAPRITCQVEAAAIELPLDLAVPCGMIINELITNAFKYAFPRDGSRSAVATAVVRIQVSLHHDRRTFILSVADNGVGLPQGFDLNTVTTLGLSLVRMLGQHQLGGHYQVDTIDGTRFTLTFSLDNRKKTDG